MHLEQGGNVQISVQISLEHTHGSEILDAVNGLGIVVL